MPESPQIIIAECNSISRLGLKVICKETILNSEIHEVSSLGELYKSMKTCKFNLLILNLFIKGQQTLTSLTELLHFQPKLNILVVSVAPERIYCTRVLKEGAKGFISQMEESDVFKLAIKRVFNGDYYFSQEHYIDSINMIEKKGQNMDHPFANLSNKELEIAYYLMKGMSNSEICEQSRLATSTISTYKMRLYSKLGIHNLLELMELASLAGLKTNDL